MPVTINQNIINNMYDSASHRWSDNPITFAIDVDPGDISGDFTGIFATEPNTTATSANNYSYIRLAFGLWADVMARPIVERGGDDDASITVNTATSLPPGSGGVAYAATLHNI
jgi:hypothetical protein